MEIQEQHLNLLNQTLDLKRFELKELSKIYTDIVKNFTPLDEISYKEISSVIQKKIFALQNNINDLESQIEDFKSNF